MSSQKYDIVVIGSGVGGITAGALLAHWGYKTLVVEKKERLGGRFSTRNIEGFVLPTCAMGIETGAYFEHAFQEVGAEFLVTRCKDISYLIDGKYYVLPPKGGLRALLNILEKTEESRAKIVGRLVKEVATEKIMGAIKGGLSKPSPEEEAMNFEDWLRQYTDNDRVLAVFRSLVYAMQGVNIKELPARSFFAFLAKGGGHMGGYREYGVAPGGNVVLVNSLAKKIQEKGSDVWSNCKAKRITVEDKIARSVIVERNGKEVQIDARVVISNIGPRTTVKLAGAEAFGEAYIKKMNDTLRPVPYCFTTFVASTRPLVEIKDIFLIVGASRITQAVPATNICPELAPPGQHLLVVWGEPESLLRPFDIEAEKQANLEDIRNTFPGFAQYGRVLLQECTDEEEEPLFRTQPGWEMPLETSIRNLYMVGDAIMPEKIGIAGGVPGCAETGWNAAEKVRKTLKPSPK